jgi:hypothetical protein
VQHLDAFGALLLPAPGVAVAGVGVPVRVVPVAPGEIVIVGSCQGLDGWPDVCAPRADLAGASRWASPVVLARTPGPDIKVDVGPDVVVAQRDCFVDCASVDAPSVTLDGGACRGVFAWGFECGLPGLDVGASATMTVAIKVVGPGYHAMDARVVGHAGARGGPARPPRAEGPPRRARPVRALRLGVRRKRCRNSAASPARPRRAVRRLYGDGDRDEG